MAKTLAINAGSSSLKFQLLEISAETVIAKGDKSSVLVCLKVYSR